MFAETSLVDPDNPRDGTDEVADLGIKGQSLSVFLSSDLPDKKHASCDLAEVAKREHEEYYLHFSLGMYGLGLNIFAKQINTI